jgi:succinate dehydrogenase / fumarate reductase cytochrome b subunit
MTKEYERPRSKPAAVRRTPAAQELKGLIDSGRTGDKVSFPDPGATPLGTDDEAAGTPDTPARVAMAIRQELKKSWANNPSCPAPVQEGNWLASGVESARPLSPNIQIYRPQLTSVLSITNRITGIFLSIGAIGIVVWLIAAANGPQPYAAVQGAIKSWIGQIVLFGCTFAFFLHLCGGIRHLVWDAGHGFALRSIYVSGWAVVAASVMLTVAAWVASLLMAA